MKNKWKQITEDIKHDLWNIRWILVAVIVWNIVIRKVFNAFCPFLIFFGIPCAGCGLTRALLAFLQGDFARACYLNPTIFAWITWFIYFVYRRYIKRDFKFVIQSLFIVCGISLGVYVYRMIFHFPSYPPMTFYRKSILQRILPGYYEWMKSIFN